MTDAKSLKWVWRGSALGVLGIGWIFILVQNSFHITAPVIYVMLAYLAGVAAVYALFRTGASAVAEEEADDPDSWGLPQSARDELDREKRTLLKAIKEAELDYQMGKLSKRDFDEMTRNYRLRAIDVIKLLEGSGGSPREQIRREIKARLEVAAVREKIERAHQVVTKRKNPAKAAAAAQAAARSAAAAGASAAEAAAAAKAAAAASDEEEEAAEKAADSAKAEAKADAKADDTKAKADDAKADNKTIQGHASGDADAKAKTEAKADDARADDAKAKADDAKAKADDAKGDDAKADDAKAKVDAAKAKADDAKADDKADDAKAKADAKVDDTKAKADEAKADDAKADEAKTNEAAREAAR